MPPTACSRRRFLRTLVVAGFTPVAHATEESGTLDITIDEGAWGQASRADIHTVVAAAADAVWRHCDGQLMRPIRVYHREDFPQTDFLHDWRGRLHIGLASEDPRWAQMAFQFGHEFCHALAQHSATAKRGWHPPMHANLWFEESLCEAASLFVLRALSAAWRTQPPDPQWRGTAAAFADYTVERLARPDHQLPADTAFPAWFREHEPALRENAALRARNVIIARQLLPLFEAEPAGWVAACYLNLGRRQQGKPLAQHFTEWQAASPAARRPFIGRVAEIFSTRLG
jgi:hypothetical protein